MKARNITTTLDSKQQQNVKSHWLWLQWKHLHIATVLCHIAYGLFIWWNAVSCNEQGRKVCCVVWTHLLQRKITSTQCGHTGFMCLCLNMYIDTSKCRTIYIWYFTFKQTSATLKGSFFFFFFQGFNDFSLVAAYQTPQAPAWALVRQMDAVACEQSLSLK